LPVAVENPVVAINRNCGNGIIYSPIKLICCRIKDNTAPSASAPTYVLGIRQHYLLLFDTRQQPSLPPLLESPAVAATEVVMV
jgi:hypothetical protein